MLLKIEFNTTCDELRPNLETLIEACVGVLESTSLREFLRFVLHTGNFINCVRTNDRNFGSCVGVEYAFA